MPVNGHVEILARRPQRIPVRIVKMFQAFEVLAGLDQHDDAPVALVYGPLHFRHGDVNATHIGDDGQRHVAVTHLAPFRERVVVRPHTVQLKLGTALEESAALHRVVGKQDLAINPVLVQCRQPVRRVVHVTRDLVPMLWEVFAHGVSHDRWAIDHATVPHDLSVHQPALYWSIKGHRHVRLVRGLCKVRDGIAPFGFRHPAGKGILVRLRM